MEQIKKGSMLKAAILSFVFACVVAVCAAMPGQMAWAANSEAPDMSGDVINVNASQAQDVLDGKHGSIDGKTINFTEDVTTVLDLARPTAYKGSNTVYYNYVNYKLQTEATPWAEDISLVMNSHSHYYRTLEGVTFTADPGVTVAGFSFDAGHIHGNGDFDYVRNVATGNGVTYYDKSSLKNITFDGLTISGCVDFSLYQEGSSVSGITFDGCTFTGDTKAAIHLLADNQYFSNVTVKNCSITNYYQGVYIQGVDGAVITNNEIVGTTHNAIALQSHENPVLGSVTVVENYIEDANDRAIRLNGVGDADIKINNNVMVDSGDSDGQLIKAGTIDDSASINLENNYWDDKDSTAVDSSLKAPATTGIVGGTFDKDVSAYLADGYEQNKDGKVVAAGSDSGNEGGQGTVTPSVPAEDGDDSKESEKTSTPKTGDAVPFAAVAGIAALAIAGVAVARRQMM